MALAVSHQVRFTTMGFTSSFVSHMSIPYDLIPLGSKLNSLIGNCHSFKFHPLNRLKEVINLFTTNVFLHSEPSFSAFRRSNSTSVETAHQKICYGV